MASGGVGIAAGAPPSPPDAQERFEELQRRLVPLWRSIEHLNADEQTIVVVPSLSVDLVDAGHVPLAAYEERLLFLLLLLRQPQARLVYVTSQPILSNVIDYYLDLLPGVIPSQARPRLFPVAVHDSSPRPLTVKLLERPRLLQHLQGLVPDRTRAHLVPFNTTVLERDLAVWLDIPMYGADPRHFRFGTKTGGRRLFADVGVPHPLGAHGVRTIDEVVDAVVALRRSRPAVTEVMVKLDEGVSGDGNALVDLRAGDGQRDQHGDERGDERVDERVGVRQAVEGMRFEAAPLTLGTFLARLREWGGVVEERIQGRDFASPSVQMRVTPLGDLEILSTHDQLLGGVDGQSYVGCVFPANPEYAALITQEAEKVGRRLAGEGVIGRFALDFVVVRDDDGGWRCFAIEVNLRKGGTTHPFLTLQFLTDGVYDPAATVFTTPAGTTKHFVASDRVESEAYRNLTVDDLFDIAVRHRLHFDHARQTGVVFHMLAALSEAGRVGMTAVGDSPDDARARFDHAVAVLDDEAAAALRR